METYIFWVEGYSLTSNTGFIKFEVGVGNNMNDAIIKIIYG